MSQGSQAPGLPPVLGGWLVSYVWGCLVFGVLDGWFSTGRVLYRVVNEAFPKGSGGVRPVRFNARGHARAYSTFFFFFPLPFVSQGAQRSQAPGLPPFCPPVLGRVVRILCLLSGGVEFQEV